jgi:hypothetical protein
METDMKKMILAAAMTLTAASAFAQYNSCEAEMIDRRGRTLEVIRAFDCQEAMKQCRIRINDLRRRGDYDCRRIENSGPIPGPQNPYPNPYPDTNPYPNPYPQYGVSATTLIESQLFEVTARDASELYINCLSDIRRVDIRNADELIFTVNGNRFRASSTSGWYNETSICSILEQEARVTSNRSMQNINARIVGSLENAPFRFEAFDRGNLLKSCIANISSLRMGNTDELQYSLNGSSFQRLTTSGWWQTPAAVCKNLMLSLDTRI